MKPNQPSSLHWHSRPRVYYPMTMGLIQPEWLYMYHFFNEESEELLPSEESANPQITSSISSSVKINIRSRGIENKLGSEKIISKR